MSTTEVLVAKAQARCKFVWFAPSPSSVSSGRRQIALPLALGPVLDRAPRDRDIFSRDSATMCHDVGTGSSAEARSIRATRNGAPRNGSGCRSSNELNVEKIKVNNCGVCRWYHSIESDMHSWGWRSVMGQFCRGHKGCRAIWATNRQKKRNGWIE